MDSWIQIALTNAFLATLLAVVVFLIQRHIRQPELVRALWLLVLVRLLFPPVFEWDVPGVASAEGWVQAAFGSGPGQSVIPPGTFSGSTGAVADSLGASNSSAPMTPSAVQLETLQSWTLPSWALGLWLAGAVVLLGVACARLVRFRAWLARAHPADPELQERVKTLALRLGVSRPPRALLVDASISPVLWAAFGSARLVVPASLRQGLSEPELDTLIVHELAHFSRGDHWVRHLELVVLTLFWWHPVAWWAKHQLHVAEERCCDTVVTRTLPDSRRSYADCLMKTMRYLADRHSEGEVISGKVTAGRGWVTGLGTFKNMKGRLTMILSDDLPMLSRTQRWALAVTALAILCVFPTLAQKEEPETRSSSVTIEAKDMKLMLVLQQIAEASELNVAVRPGVDMSMPITMQAVEQPWNEVLTELLKKTDLRAHQEGDQLWIFPWEKLDHLGHPSALISLDMRKADVKEALAAIAFEAGVPITFADGVEGPVSFHIRDAPWDSFFKTVVRMKGLGFQVKNGGIYVFPLTPAGSWAWAVPNQDPDLETAPFWF